MTPSQIAQAQAMANHESTSHTLDLDAIFSEPAKKPTGKPPVDLDAPFAAKRSDLYGHGFLR
jgi:hypothetical protein